jgi:Tol biopolymer transport system component
VAGGGGKDSPASFIRTDGTGLEEGIAPINLMLWPYAASWSPDGTHLTYASYEWATDLAEMRILDMDSGTTTSFYTRTGSLLTPAWSSDGKAIAVLVQSYPRELVFLETATKRTLTKSVLPAKWEGGLEIFWSPAGDRVLVPFDLLRHEIGFVSLPSGDHSELSVGNYSRVLGWTKDGKSLVILGDEDDQEAIWIMPLK